MGLMLVDAIALELPRLRAEAEALMVDTCVRRRYTNGAADSYGMPTRTANLVTLSCRKTPAAGNEATTDRNVQTHEAVFHFPFDSDVLGGDELVHGGDTWQVVGPPETQSWPVRLKVFARRTEAL